MTRPQLHLLDTNTCIYIMNEEPQQVRDKMLHATMSGHVLGISSITLHELWLGVWRSSRQATNSGRLSRFVSGLHVFPFDDAAAEISSEVRATLLGLGQPIGPYDMLIAGHTLSLSAVLVTNNTKEFSRVAGLKFEDWTV